MEQNVRNTLLQLNSVQYTFTTYYDLLKEQVRHEAELWPFRQCHQKLKLLMLWKSLICGRTVLLDSIWFHVCTWNVTGLCINSLPQSVMNSHHTVYSHTAAKIYRYYIEIHIIVTPDFFKPWICQTKFIC